MTAGDKIAKNRNIAVSAEEKTARNRNMTATAEEKTARNRNMTVTAEEKTARNKNTTRCKMARVYLTPAPTPPSSVMASKTANRLPMRQTVVRRLSSF